MGEQANPKFKCPRPYKFFFTGWHNYIKSPFLTVCCESEIPPNKNAIRVDPVEGKEVIWELSDQILILDFVLSWKKFWKKLSR